MTEIGQIEEALGPQPLTPVEAFHLSLANFTLTLTQIRLCSREVSPIPIPTMRKIVIYCGMHCRFVPMLVYNQQFRTEFTYMTESPVLPDATLSNLMSGKVVAYREKIDGALVWKSSVRGYGQEYECFIGAISMPTLLPIHTFELKGLKAYSINPVNIETSVISGEQELEFVKRPYYSAPKLEWEDGAVAIMNFTGRFEERRVKMRQSSELSFERGITTVGRDSFFVVNPQTGKALEGVYECVSWNETVVPIRYRPFKTHDPNFQARMNLPDVLQAPELTTEFQEGENYALLNQVLTVPKTIVMPPAFLDCARSERSLVPFISLEGSPVPLNSAVAMVGDVLVFSYSDLVGVSSSFECAIRGPDAFILPDGRKIRRQYGQGKGSVTLGLVTVRFAEDTQVMRREYRDGDWKIRIKGFPPYIPYPSVRSWVEFRSLADVKRALACATPVESEQEREMRDLIVMDLRDGPISKASLRDRLIQKMPGFSLPMFTHLMRTGGQNPSWSEHAGMVKINF